MPMARISRSDEVARVPSTYSSDRLTPPAGGIRDGAHRRVAPPRPCPCSAAAHSAARVRVLRQNSVRRQVIDLAGLIQRKFRLDGPPPAPPASTASPPLRRSPPCRLGEPGPT